MLEDISTQRYNVSAQKSAETQHLCFLDPHYFSPLLSSSSYVKILFQTNSPDMQGMQTELTFPQFSETYYQTWYFNTWNAGYCHSHRTQVCLFLQTLQWPVCDSDFVSFKNKTPQDTIFRWPTVHSSFFSSETGRECLHGWQKQPLGAHSAGGWKCFWTPTMQQRVQPRRRKTAHQLGVYSESQRPKNKQENTTAYNREYSASPGMPEGIIAQQATDTFLKSQCPFFEMSLDIHTLLAFPAHSDWESNAFLNYFSWPGSLFTNRILQGKLEFYSLE